MGGLIEMKVIVNESSEGVDLAAAHEVVKHVRIKPDSVLGLATGNTTIGLHKAVVKLHKECCISFSNVVTFNVDEYVGVPPDHPASCRVRIFEQLLDCIDVRKENCHLPDGNAEDLNLAARQYENLVAAAGGIDLQILSVGPNGHIGFNEPGTPFESRSHVAEISSRSLEVKSGFYRETGFHPRKAITLGIRNIMNARKILFVAKGSEKSAIVRKALLGPVTPEVPASVLQLHPNVLILLDSLAAASLVESDVP
jgi:glucosamine-6-phosphate deaminase